MRNRSHGVVRALLFGPRFSLPPTFRRRMATRPRHARHGLTPRLCDPCRATRGDCDDCRSRAARARRRHDRNRGKGNYVRDVAIWNKSDLTIRGVGGPVRIIAGGASAEAKATWVVRGDRIVVENLTFIGSRVPDRNGAGIRLERGRLKVVDCAFLDNQNGILTANNADIELEIERQRVREQRGGRWSEPQPLRGRDRQADGHRQLFPSRQRRPSAQEPGGA